MRGDLKRLLELHGLPVGAGILLALLILVAVSTWFKPHMFSILPLLMTLSGAVVGYLTPRADKTDHRGTNGFMVLSMVLAWYIAYVFTHRAELPGGLSDMVLLILASCVFNGLAIAAGAFVGGVAGKHFLSPMESAAPKMTNPSMTPQKVTQQALDSPYSHLYRQGTPFSKWQNKQ